MRVIKYNPISGENERVWIFGKNPKKKTYTDVEKHAYGLDVGPAPTFVGAFDEFDDLLEHDAKPRGESKSFHNWVEDIDIYPDDTLEIVKLKIYIVTGIKPAFQHLFWITERVETTYAINIGYNIDIDATTQLRPDNLDSTIVIEDIVPIDNTIDEYRDEAIVWPRDYTELVSTVFIHTKTIWIIDVRDYFTKLTVYLTALKDESTIRLFYWGFIFKWWPMLTYDCINTIIKYGLNEFEMQYPELNPNMGFYETQYKLDTEMRRKYMPDMRVAENPNLRKFIHSVELVFTPTNATSIDIHETFNKVKCNQTVVSVDMYIEHISRYIPIKYRVMKRYFTHADSEVFLEENPVGKTRIIFGIFHGGLLTWMVAANDGELSAYMKFRDIENVDFNSLKDLSNDYLKRNIRLISYDIDTIPRGITSYRNMTASFVWKRAVHEQALDTALKKFIKCGIIEQKLNKLGAPLPGGYLWKRGMYDLDLNKFTRSIWQMLKSNIKNIYEINTNPVFRAKWLSMMSGKQMTISMKKGNVKIEIKNVSETEFEIIEVYITTLFAAILQGDKSVSKASRVPSNLLENDPMLFDLKGYGLKKVYSVKCQGSRQPVLANPTDPGAVKYYNFTRNKPEYYRCTDKRYPNLGFLTRVHPNDWCIPCCTKLTNQAIIKSCLKNHTYRAESKERLIKHIFTWSRAAGGPTPVGRLITPPSALSVVRDAYCISIDVGQWGGYIESIAFCFNMSTSQFMDYIISLISKLNSMSVILNGSLSKVFDNIDELCKYIHDVFCSPKAIDQVLFTEWVKLVEDILWLYYRTVIMFYEQNGEITVPNRVVSAENILCIVVTGWGALPLCRVDVTQIGVGDFILSKIWQKTTDDDLFAIVKPVKVKISDRDGITEWWVNRTGSCYAVTTTSGVYIPTNFLIDSTIDQTRVKWKPWQRWDAGGSAQRPSKVSSMHSYTEATNLNITVKTKVYSIVNDTKKYVGLQTSDGQFIYADIDDIDLPETVILYDPIDINLQLYNTPSHILTRNSMPITLGQFIELYKYEMLYLEFANKIRMVRNDAFRKDLINDIKQMSGNEFIQALRLKTNISDYVRIKEILLQNTPVNLKVDKINQSLFDFDMRMIENWDRNKIRQILLDSITGTKDGYSKEISIPSRLKPCIIDQQHCSGGKIIIPLDDKTINTSVDIILHDIKSHIKRELLFSDSTKSHIIDVFRFKEEPYEVLSIKEYI